MADDCSECGMELDPDWDQCPKCDTPAGRPAPVPGFSPRSSRPSHNRPRKHQHKRGGQRGTRADDQAHTIDIGHGGYASADIPALLDQALSDSVVTGCTLLRIVHGYGSSGRGGTLMHATRAHCQRWQSAGRIRAWLSGADLSAPPRAPFSEADISDLHNRGVTLVAL